MGKFIQEFKEFAVRGNAVDMAVGVIIGGAFGKNEAGDLTPDEDILRLLRRAFDRAGGSTEYLAGCSLAELVRWVREGKHGTD